MQHSEVRPCAGDLRGYLLCVPCSQIILTLKHRLSQALASPPECLLLNSPLPFSGSLPAA